MTERIDTSLFVTETIQQESELVLEQRIQHSSAFSTLDQPWYALEYPADTNQTDKEEETSTAESNDK